MRDIRKWYMRLLLMLASAFMWFHLFISMFMSLYAREEGFLNYQLRPFIYLNNFLETYISNGNIIEGLFCVLALITIIGPLKWPRIFIWPVMAVNLFICVGSINLIWRHFMVSPLHGSGPWGTLDASDWLVVREFFIFSSGLFVALLLPAALHLVTQSGWYQRRWN